MLKEIRHTRSFVAVGEGGAEWTIHIFTEIVDAGTFADRTHVFDAVLSHS